MLAGAQLSQPIAKYYANSINDLVQQADEVDGRVLQYEGGIGTTALVFNAFYEVAEKADLPVKIDPKQLAKFASYFTTKRHVATLRSAYYLTKVFKHLSDNKVRVHGNIELYVDTIKCFLHLSRTPCQWLWVVSALHRSTRRILRSSCQWAIFSANPLEKCPFWPSQRNAKKTEPWSFPSKSSRQSPVTCTFAFLLMNQSLTAVCFSL